MWANSSDVDHLGDNARVNPGYCKGNFPAGGGGALTKSGVDGSFLSQSGRTWACFVGNRFLYEAVIDYFSCNPLEFSLK